MVVRDDDRLVRRALTMALVLEDGVDSIGDLRYRIGWLQVCYPLGGLSIVSLEALTFTRVTLRSPYRDEAPSSSWAGVASGSAW